MAMLLVREEHPVADTAAQQNAELICQPRGYCGPFINTSFYDAFPDPLWNGKGECALCATTCDVATQEALRDRVMAD